MKPIADISAWQKPESMNYDALVEGTSGVILRACYGIGKDRYLDRHYEEITNRQGLLGFYHFLFGNMSMASQVEAFENALVGKKWQLGLWADVEMTSSSKISRKQLDEYLQLARERISPDIGIYTSQYMWDTMIGSAVDNDVKLWIANYGVKVPALPKFGGWDSWWLWQYTSKGSIEGVNERFDLNWFFGDEVDFGNWTGHSIMDPVARLEQAIVKMCQILGIDQDKVLGT